MQHRGNAASFESDFALRMWTPEIEALTALRVNDALKPVYQLLESTVDYTSIATHV